MNEEEVLNDWRRRYLNTFVFVKSPNEDDEHLFYVDRVNSSSTKVATISLTSDEVGSITLNFGSQHTLRFVPPPVGTFQFGADAFLCRRTPRRQWRRGICGDNTELSTVSHTFAAVPFDGGMTWAKVNAAFQRRAYRLQEALKMLASGKYRSVAMVDQLSLIQSTTAKSNDYILTHWDQPIARLDEKGKLVLVYEKAFEPQINQFLVREENGTY